MRASDIRTKPERVVETTIRLGDTDVFTVSFDANKITRYWANTADMRGVFGVYEALCEVLTGWDIVNDDGSPYPLTPEAMAELQFTLTQEAEIVEQIMVAAQPARAEGNASANTSSIPVTVSSSLPAIPQNGPQPSPSPEPLVSPYQP